MRQNSPLLPQLHESLGQLGVRIRRARKLQQLTLCDMEAKCGIHRTTLGRLEHGDQGVGIGTLFVVLSALGKLEEAERILCAPSPSQVNQPDPTQRHA